MESRQSVVQVALDSRPEWKTIFDRDEAKAAVLPYVVAALNKFDQTKDWGILIKTDQGNKVPNDVVVWKPTMRHIDVLPGEGFKAIWDDKGIVDNPSWVWAAPGPVGDDPVVVQPPTSQPDDQPTVEEIVQAIIQGLAPAIATAVAGNLQVLYDQNERIFTNLSEQNSELRSLFIARTPLMNGAQDSGAILRPERTEGIHLPPDAVNRIADIAGNVRQIPANRRK